MLLDSPIGVDSETYICVALESWVLAIKEVNSVEVLDLMAHGATRRKALPLRWIPRHRLISRR